MFGDGKVDVINQDGELYINMWGVVHHLVNSSFALEQEEGTNVAVLTLRMIASTLCDLALYELGMDSLEDINDVQSMIELWETSKP